MRRFIVVTAIFLLTATSAFSQYSKLRDFGTQSEGVAPYAALATDGTFLYGVTAAGGNNEAGTIYKFNPATKAITILHHLDKSTGDGSYAELLLDGGTLYGVALTGGANGHGYLFKINADGTNFTNIFDFNYGVSGGYPFAGLITDGNVLYGVTEQGGANSSGVVFKINKDGTGYTKLYEFVYAEGGYPDGKLTSDGTYLYGTTTQGGANSQGTVFKVKTDGTGFTTLINFNGSNGSSPRSGLFFDGTFLWGLTQLGGASGRGVLFRILPDGTGYTIFSNFNDGVTGGGPKSALISDGTYLYGTTAQDGATFGGTVFRIKLDGSGFSKVIDLKDGAFGSRPEGTLTIVGSTLYGTRSSGGHALRGAIYQVDTNGANFNLDYSFRQQGNSPLGTLTSDGTYLYGVTERGGEYNFGTVYKIKPDGSGFQNLVDFDGPAMGGRPLGGVFFDGTKLYGTTQEGGSSNKGTLYYVNTDGSNFTKLVDFDGATRGDTPSGSLISDGTYLYGTTYYGGANGVGAIFKVMTNGSNFTRIYDFTGNPSGAYPTSNLIIDVGVLYGATQSGGGFDSGTLYKINTDGSNFTQLHEFDYTNGAYPRGGLYANGTSLYGLTSAGGDDGGGTVYKIEKSGSGFETMFHLKLVATGVAPAGSFTSDGTYLYAVTAYGGSGGSGTILRVAFDGTYKRFMDFADGRNPVGSLYSDGTFLYGITSIGGTYDLGVLYKRSIAPAVNIVDFDPKYGAPGTYVTIQGNDFDPDITKNKVEFNGAEAEILTAKIDTLIVLVPEAGSSGPITITANSTSFSSLADFSVEGEAFMNNVKVRTCDVTFTGAGGDDDLTMTFEPAVAGAKLKVTFTEMDITDRLIVFDGPDLTTPIDTLEFGDNSFTYTAKGSGGQLTFYYWWQDEGSDWEANISCVIPGGPATIDIVTQPVDIEACKKSQAIFTTSASGANNITYQWQTSDDGNSNWTDLTEGGDFKDVKTASLKINVTDVADAGWYRSRINGGNATEVFTNGAELTVKACDLVVYNAVSPNNDGKNEIFFIENIDVIPGKQENTVKIFNRWGDEVFSVANYNNTDRIFNGTNKHGNKLPTGTYFYKITFSGGDDLTGYLELKY